MIADFLHFVGHAAAFNVAGVVCKLYHGRGKRSFFVREAEHGY